MKRTALTVVLILCILVVMTMPALAGEIRVSAAASLKEVLNELSEGFARKDPGVKFQKNYGASGALARQIESGLPADIFISANVEWTDYLKQKKLLDPQKMGTLAYNTLVFAGPATSKISGMRDLVKANRVAIGSPKSVPAGEYAMEAMKRAGIERQLSAKLVMAKDVRDCLMYAERGEVDGAFVYLTDALQAKHVKVLFTVPQDLYPRVVYPMALTVGGTKNKDAAAFYRYLQSAEAKAVLTKYGFSVK